MSEQLWTRGSQRINSARVLDMRIVGDKIIWWARDSKSWQHGVCLAADFGDQLGNKQFDLVVIEETWRRKCKGGALRCGRSSV